MDYNKEINTIIERALTEKTFNLEIIEEIKKLRELPEKLEEANKQLETIRLTNSTLTKELSELKNREIDVTAREKVIAEKEIEQRITDEKNKSKDIILKEYKDVMSLVFRNTTVRENLYNNKMVYHQSGGYPNQFNESESINKEVIVE